MVDIDTLDQNIEDIEKKLDALEDRADKSGPLSYSIGKEDVTITERNGRYTIIPVARRTHINPGDELIIDLYITGYGLPKLNKLSISFSAQEVLSDSGKSYLSIYHYDNYGNSGDFRTREEIIETSHTTVKLPTSFFVYNPEAGNVYTSLMSEIIHSKDNEQIGPIHIHLNTNKNIPPGTHKIYTTFTYDINDQTYQDESSLNIHVNSWTERNRRELRISAIILSVILVLFSLFNLFLGLISIMVDIL